MIYICNIFEVCLHFHLCDFQMHPARLGSEHLATALESFMVCALPEGSEGQWISLISS